MTKPTLPLLGLCALWSLTGGPGPEGMAWGEQLQLRHGAHISGVLQERGADGDYVLRPATGITLRLPASQVVQVLSHSPALEIYHERAPAVPDTVAAHWELAEWCARHGLSNQREVHLRRITELDSEHAAAWKALGYVLADGQWMRMSDRMREKGYVLYEGKWRLGQEAALMERDRRQERAERSWLIRIQRWRQDLNSSRAAAALQNFAQIRDPAALPALAALLPQERQRAAKQVYLAAIQQLDDPRRWDVLFTTSLQDPDEEIFHGCLDALCAQPRPDLTKAYVEALKSPSNLRVNRAGYALGRLGDPSALSPLIEALVTPHQLRVQPASSATTTQLVRPVGAGGEISPAAEGLVMSQGPQQKRSVTVWIANRYVHDALVELTGVSFGYDQQQWRHWYAAHVASGGSRALLRSGP